MAEDDKEYRQSIRANQLTHFGLKQFTRAQLNSYSQHKGLTKGELADMAGLNHAELVFDYALPQQWLNEFTRQTGINYQMVSGTTFVLYSSKFGVCGLIWSANKEIDELISQ